MRELPFCNCYDTGYILPKHRILILVVALALLPAPAGALAAPWATQTAPAPADLSDSALGPVSCVSASWCMALGAADNGENAGGTALLDAASFAESWNGSGWATSAIAPAPGGTAVMVGVSCTSPTFCLAVGAVGQPPGPTPASPLGSVLAPHARPLAELWNGTTWAVAPALHPAGKMYADLSGVSCLSRRLCVAVGSKGPVEGGNGVLVEVFDGTRWRIQATPRLPHESGALDAVSCVAADACTAVGSDDNEPKSAQEGASDALVERWNGRRWSVQRSLYSRPRDGDITLTGVSCGSRSRCLAVGTLAFNGGAKPRAEKWNGKRWVATPGLPPWSALEGVSCTSPTGCVAVGQYQPSYYPPASLTEPLVERWDGDRWTKQAVPNAGAPKGPNLGHEPHFPTFFGVSCVAAGTCTAVGGSGSHTHVQTLAQSNAPSTPSAVA
jgi:hypothetical protein